MSETQHTEPGDNESDPPVDDDKPIEDDKPHDEPSKPPIARNGKAARRKKHRPAPPLEEEVSEPQTDEGSAPADEPQVLPVGNPLRPLRGGILLVAGMFAAFCLMAVNAQLRYGVPLGALAILVATFGALDLAGTFDDPDDRIAGRVTLAALARPLGVFLGGAISLWGFVCLAVDGRLSARYPVLAAGVLVPASFLVTVVGVYQIADSFGVWAAAEGSVPRPLHRRHGFWLVVLTTLLYLPLLGSHSLSDPWETHYGEVSREILSRNDWISTWWAQDGWFWSKPVLDFWIQALAMATFGVHYKSNQVLSAVSEGRVPWPEWAVRLPIFLLSLLSVYLLYKAVARVFGRRAGLLGGVVLVTMPQWFLLTHQTMTDMPFVAPMVSAMALLLLGTYEDPDEEVRVYELSLGPVSLRFSALHLVLGATIVCALPQILYLLSRNVLLDMRGFHGQFDSFMSGSPGNCGLPGNEACRVTYPVVRGLHPALQALIWAQAITLVVYLNWGERRRQRLYFLSAWLFAALSTMAKGPAGFGLPVLCMLAYIAVSRRWRDLLRLEIASGVLILLAVALPWFVAMYVRHGQPFTDRLIFHDMFKRAFTHVHDTNEGEDVSFRFYVWQLGYATFPWTGLLPAALLWWLRLREEDDRKADASVFLVMWFTLAFAGFSVMLTKFHHYILPALPPVAMLTGVLLDSMLDRGLPRGARPQNPLSKRGTGPSAHSWVDIALYGAGFLVGTVALLWGGSRLFAFVAAAPGTVRSVNAALAGAGVAALGLASIVAAVLIVGRSVMPPLAESGEPRVSEGSAAAFRGRFETAQLGAVGVAGAILVFAVGRDLSANQEGLPNQIRLMHLVTYNYRRPWPPSLDFTPTLWAFTVLAALLGFALMAARVRRHVVAALVALGVAFGVWGIDVYFMQISPHWGQRETTIAYYQAAREAPGPLIAYQMNWKGENFYTGNHVPAFVSSGKKFTDYILDEKKKGVHTLYFVTEHGRTGTLSNELGPTKAFEKLTTPELDNKFVLVRAQFDG
jgi:4-amino-4-deoxy-L-arabinose transferase-like glycosyltransferase